MKDVSCNDQRHVTDDQFLDHLNLPGSYGKQLKKARGKGDADGKKEN